MNLVPPIGLIVMGVASVIVGVKAHTFYGAIGMAKMTNKQVDPAVGRLMFCIGGVVLVLIGVCFLVVGLRQ